MKQLRTRLLSLFFAMILLTGCGATPSNRARSTGSGQQIRLSIWTYYNGAQLTAFNDLVDEFNATTGKELGIFVESSSQGSVGDLTANVLAAAAGKVGANEVPNIFAAYPDTAYQLDQMGLVADLRPYLTDADLDAFVESYIREGQFSGDIVKIFPIAKSTELLLLNKTDWDVFADATGASLDTLSTIEGITATAQAYYEWTDSRTPAPNDGKAFFGRDALSNYFLISAIQLGTELFPVQNGTVSLQFDRSVVHKIWDNYYVPFVKGYFAASGRFRSDDVKTGNVLAFVGSSSGSTFFPREVVLSDTESHPIEMLAFPCPQFKDAQPYAVQQGAGMVVTTGDDAKVRACVEFLKWFSQDERDIRFCIGSGYLPVTKQANDLETIRAHSDDLTPVMERVLSVALDTVHKNTLYTPSVFANATQARDVLKAALEEQAKADRDIVSRQLAAGASLEEATAPFVSDDAFDAWYQNTRTQLESLVG